MMIDIVVIDVESTGTDTDTNDIIGISSVLLQSQKVTGLKYETWCNAPKEFDKEALKIIGKQLGFFEELSKDPRQFVPREYFESLPALEKAWKACKKHYQI